MIHPVENAHYSVPQVNPDSGELTIGLGGKLERRAVQTLLSQLEPYVRAAAPRNLSVDLGDVTYCDDFGILLLSELKQMVGPEGQFKLLRIPPQTAESLGRANFDNLNSCAFPIPARSYGLWVNLGDSIFRAAADVKSMLVFLGDVILAFAQLFIHPRSLRVGDTISQMERTGVQALPIVVLISFLLGLIMAFMSSLQLAQFGANIYVASLVAMAMVSELGPIMTAIIVAGRTGSAFAAEIGTMKISEEVDALSVMGFDPTLFLVIPRMIAAVVVVPVLTLFANLFAIMGGLVVGVSVLHLTAHSYINQTLETLTIFDVIWGLSKSVVFAVLIAWVGCLRGFQARGGTASVGQAATSAVVSSIFMIVVIDSIFAIIRSYW